MFVLLPESTTLIVSMWTWSLNDNEWSWTAASIDFYVIPSMCVTVWYEPTDSEKACKPFLSDAWKSLSYSSPNLVELCTMNQTLDIQTPEGKQKYIMVSTHSVKHTLPLVSVSLYVSCEKCKSCDTRWGCGFVLWGGSASELPRWGAECCCGSFTPPSGASPLSGGDAGG